MVSMHSHFDMEYFELL